MIISLLKQRKYILLNINNFIFFTILTALFDKATCNVISVMTGSVFQSGLHQIIKSMIKLNQLFKLSFTSCYLMQAMICVVIKSDGLLRYD